MKIILITVNIFSLFFLMSQSKATLIYVINTYLTAHAFRSSNSMINGVIIILYWKLLRDEHIRYVIDSGMFYFNLI